MKRSGNVTLTPAELNRKTRVTQPCGGLTGLRMLPGAAFNYNPLCIVTQKTDELTDQVLLPVKVLNTNRRNRVTQHEREP